MSKQSKSILSLTAASCTVCQHMLRQPGDAFMLRTRCSACMAIANHSLTRLGVAVNAALG